MENYEIIEMDSKDLEELEACGCTCSGGAGGGSGSAY